MVPTTLCITSEESQFDEVAPFNDQMVSLFALQVYSGAYEALKESGCLKLPSQCTLWNYTHVIKAANGFTLEGDEQLVRVAELSRLME